MEEKSRQTLRQLCTHLEEVSFELCYPLFQLVAVCRRCCVICSLLEQGARLCLRCAKF